MKIFQQHFLILISYYSLFYFSLYLFICFHPYTFLFSFSFFSFFFLFFSPPHLYTPLNSPPHTYTSLSSLYLHLHFCFVLQLSLSLSLSHTHTHIEIGESDLLGFFSHTWVFFFLSFFLSLRFGPFFSLFLYPFDLISFKIVI